MGQIMIRVLVVVAIVGLGLGVGVLDAAAACPPDSVESGTGCIGKYEASLWYIAPPLNVFERQVIAKIKTGTVTLANLNRVGAVQLGLVEDDLVDHGCPVTGNGCLDVYAVSIPGVTPAAWVNWFQAAAALRNAGARFPTNAEWQTAALGTPDTGGGGDDGATTCNTDNLAPGVTATGSRSSCQSDVGAFDMVGNLWEWVADWVPRSTTCTGWDPAFSNDLMCLAGATESRDGAGALLRGGFAVLGSGAGVFAIFGTTTATASDKFVGFRAAR